MNTSEEANELISSIENKHGGLMVWKTMVFSYCDTDKIIKDNLFLCKIGDSFFFEDFEKNFTFLGLKVSKPKNYVYSKFEGCFKSSDVVSVDKVSMKSAKAFCMGEKKSVRKSFILGQSTIQIKLKNSKVLFMEIMNSEEFIKFFR